MAMGSRLTVSRAGRTSARNSYLVPAVWSPAVMPTRRATFSGAGIRTSEEASQVGFLRAPEHERLRCSFLP